MGTKQRTSAGQTSEPVSLRDQFAMAALQGLLTMQSSPVLGMRQEAYFDHGRRDLIAKDAYLLADAMLAARSA